MCTCALFEVQSAIPEFLHVTVVGSQVALSSSSGGFLHVSSDRVSVGCRVPDFRVQELANPLPSELFAVHACRGRVTLTASTGHVVGAAGAAGSRVTQLVDVHSCEGEGSEQAVVVLYASYDTPPPPLPHGLIAVRFTAPPLT
jgi:hypothetical protein